MFGMPDGDVGVARDALRAAGDEFKACQTSLEAARAHLAEVIVQALKAGMKQNEVVALSGYTRERVRTIARSAGIPPR